jgi:hypothetical protein
MSVAISAALTLPMMMVLGPRCLLAHPGLADNAKNRETRQKKKHARYYAYAKVRRGSRPD